MRTSDVIPAATDEIQERIQLAHQRFAAVLTATPPDLAVGEWTAADVGAHVLTVINRYTEFRPDRLASSPRGVDAINEREVAALRGTSVAEILGQLAAELAEFGRSWGTELPFPLDMPIPFHGGSIDVQAGLVNALGELLLHGRDIATALGEPWPIDGRDAALLCGLAAQILPAYVRASNPHRVAIEVAVDGISPWRLDVDGPVGTVSVAGDGAAELLVRGPAEPFVLLTYGRVDSAEALSLGLRVDGLPDRAAVLDELFEKP